jgi:hypothetical protein
MNIVDINTCTNDREMDAFGEKWNEYPAADLQKIIQISIPGQPPGVQNACFNIDELAQNIISRSEAGIPISTNPLVLEANYPLWNDLNSLYHILNYPSMDPILRNRLQDVLQPEIDLYTGAVAPPWVTVLYNNQELLNKLADMGMSLSSDYTADFLPSTLKLADFKDYYNKVLKGADLKAFENMPMGASGKIMKKFLPSIKDACIHGGGFSFISYYCYAFLNIRKFYPDIQIHPGMVEMDTPDTFLSGYSYVPTSISDNVIHVLYYNPAGSDGKDGGTGRILAYNLTSSKWTHTSTFNYRSSLINKIEKDAKKKFMTILPFLAQNLYEQKKHLKNIDNEAKANKLKFKKLDVEKKKSKKKHANGGPIVLKKNTKNKPDRILRQGVVKPENDCRIHPELCFGDKICNPVSGRCVGKNGALGIKIQKMKHGKEIKGIMMNDKALIQYGIQNNGEYIQYPDDEILKQYNSLHPHQMASEDLKKYINILAKSLRINEIFFALDVLQNMKDKGIDPNNYDLKNLLSYDTFGLAYFLVQFNRGIAKKSIDEMTDIFIKDIYGRLNIVPDRGPRILPILDNKLNNINKDNNSPFKMKFFRDPEMLNFTHLNNSNNNEPQIIKIKKDKKKTKKDKKKDKKTKKTKIIIKKNSPKSPKNNNFNMGNKFNYKLPKNINIIPSEYDKPQEEKQALNEVILKAIINSFNINKMMFQSYNTAKAKDAIIHLVHQEINAFGILQNFEDMENNCKEEWQKQFDLLVKYLINELNFNNTNYSNTVIIKKGEGKKKYFIIKGKIGKELKAEFKALNGKYNKTFGGWTFIYSNKKEVYDLLKKHGIPNIDSLLHNDNDNYNMNN